VHGEHSHLHFHDHDTGWQSFVLRSIEPQDPEKLKAAVREVALKQPILRAKGFANVTGKAHRLVVQAVRSRVNTYFEPHGHPEPESSLVFIGYHPRREAVAALLHDITGAEWR
nr:GTP-binding protein [Verrucomicrobiota bacterium]